MIPRSCFPALLGALLLGTDACAQDGALDLSFDPGIGASWSVIDIVIQPDERIMLGGWFSTFNGIGNGFLVRLDQDGSVDPLFTTGQGPNSFVTTLVQRPDGRTLIGGNFTQYDGVACPFAAQLLPGGGLETVMGGPSILFVEAMRLLPDGRALVVGLISPGFITLLEANGAPDPSFQPGAGANELLRDAQVLPNGQFLIAGMFWSYDGVPIQGVARINADGSLDGTFGGSGGPDGPVDRVVLQPDGRILLSGGFSTYAGVQVNGLCRILPDGALDVTFSSGITSGGVVDMAVQPDGRILIGGTFTQYAGVARNRIARLEPDGSLDLGFDPGAGANQEVNAIALQPDGRVVIGGSFTTYNGVPRARVARLLNTLATSTSEPDEQLVQAQVVPGAVMVPSGWDGPARLVVMDHAGRVVVARREVVPPGGAAIELGELAPGGYLVRLELTGRRMVGRTFIH